MYQYQIYPTGLVDNYILRVNSPLGVTAIIDRGMGINEHSLSGIAFYINTIENYINRYNVGSSGNHIISGYFDSIGYFEIENGQISDKYITTSDGILSGVYDIWTSGVTIEAGSQDIDIQKLVVTSGLFYNTIFDESILVTQAKTSIASLTLSDGCIQNLYSGYIDNTLARTNTPFLKGNKALYPYYISDTICGIGDIVQSVRLRPNLDYAASTYGIIDGFWKCLDFTAAGIDLLVSGNLYVDGGLLLDGNSIAASSVHENIFRFDVHNHDGINSRVITASGLGSCEEVKEPFYIICTSGSLEVEDTLHGNIIGLSSNWEEVPADKIIANPLRLLTFGDKLMILSQSEMQEYEGDAEPMRVKPGAFIVGGCITPSHDGGMGDDFAAYYFDPPYVDCTNYIGFRRYGIEPLRLSMMYWQARTTYTMPLSHGIDLTANGTYPTEPHIMFQENSNPIFHINDKCYCIAFMVRSGTLFGYQDLGLYEIDPENMTCRLVAYNENAGIFAPLISYFQMESNIVYGDAYAVFNPMYTHKSLREFNRNRTVKQTYKNWGWDLYTETISSDAVSETENIIASGYGGLLGMVQSDIITHTPDTTYLLNNSSNIIFQLSNSNSTFKPVSITPMSGMCSILAVGHTLLTGQALQIQYSPTGEKIIDDRYFTRLQDITGNTDPWIKSAVIHDGWIYAIAATQDNYTEWCSEFAKYPPRGTKIIRRRIAEQYRAV